MYGAGGGVGVSNAVGWEDAGGAFGAGGGGGLTGGAGAGGIIVISYTPAPIHPTVSTQSAVVTGPTSAILNGSLDNTGGADVYERGFAWGTSPTLSGGDTATTSDTVGQPFAVGPFGNGSLNFVCGTTYYSRAYAINSIGTGFGSVSASFATNCQTVSRVMRLFQGYRIKIVSGRLKIMGQILCQESVTFGGLTYISVLAKDGECWLDRNLGATQVATSKTDWLAYGSLFQWGRAPDGHQLITCTGPLAANCSADNGSTDVNADVPANALFITETVSPYDWRVNPDDTLWASVSSTNNPCPSGFRVPTQAEWVALAAAEGITNSASDDKAFASTLKLTLAGNHNNLDAGVYNQTSWGYYWSSSPVSTNASFLSFNSTTVVPAGDYYRAAGYSVRCLKD